MTPVLTVKELMEHIVDPQADYVFDAVSVDVGPNGVVETTPTTDEDWTRIERGAWVLAESSNLLKLPRKMAPDHVKRPGGPGAPELSPQEIEAKVKANPQLWNSHADALRDEAVKIIAIVKARDAEQAVRRRQCARHGLRRLPSRLLVPGRSRSGTEESPQQGLYRQARGRAREVAAILVATTDTAGLNREVGAMPTRSPPL